MNRLPAALLRSLATILIVVAAVVVAIWMWTHYERSPWTRDGRVRADVVRVTPDISGLVTSVAVRDNQRVKAGDLLFVIDTPRYHLALEQARSQIASAQAVLGQARREARRDLALGDLVAAETHEQNVAKVETAQAALTEAMSAREGAGVGQWRGDEPGPASGRLCRRGDAGHGADRRGFDPRGRLFRGNQAGVDLRRCASDGAVDGRGAGFARACREHCVRHQ